MNKLDSHDRVLNLDAGFSRNVSGGGILPPCRSEMPQPQTCANRARIPQIENLDKLIIAQPSSPVMM